MKDVNYPLEIALSYYGVTELPGKASNPIICEWMRCIQAPFVVDNVNWCGIAMGYWHWMALYSYPRKPWVARNWLKLPIKVIKPSLGDVAILWRGHPTKDWRGHVAFYISESKDNVYLLGGNQSDRVCIQEYDKGRVLGYRRAQKDPIYDDKK